MLLLTVVLCLASGSVAVRASAGAQVPAQVPAQVLMGGIGGIGGTDGALPVRPVVVPDPRAVAWLLADETTGQVLASRNADQPRAMASTTKVMTALLVLERLPLDRQVTVGVGPTRVGEESLNLRVGERFTVGQLLQGLMVKSANDAAAALAEAADGGQDAFVARMNQRAAQLRLRDTHFVTPYGLDEPGHHTTARDLARIWETAMRLPAFRDVVDDRRGTLPGGTGATATARHYVTTNDLLGRYPWMAGGKTGFTNRAGRCLVASGERAGRRLVAVALGAPDDASKAFPDVRGLLDYGFTEFVRARLVTAGQTVTATDGTTWRAGGTVDALVRRDQLGALQLVAPTSRDGGGASTLTVRAGSAPVAIVRATPGGDGSDTSGTSGQGDQPGALRATAVPPGSAPTRLDPFLAVRTTSGTASDTTPGNPAANP